MIVRRVVANVTRKQEVLVVYDDKRSITDVYVVRELSDEPVLDIITEKQCTEWSEDDYDTKCATGITNI